MLRRETKGNWRRKYPLIVMALAMGAAFIHRGYGLSSYCCLTRSDTLSSIGVRRGTEVCSFLSSCPSRTWRATSAATGADQVRPGIDSTTEREASGKYAATATSQSSGKDVPDASTS